VLVVGERQAMKQGAVVLEQSRVDEVRLEEHYLLAILPDCFDAAVGVKEEVF
jgi:hypothetical protein